MTKMSIDRIGEYVGAYQKGGKIAVVTDETVGELYLGRIATSLTNSGFAGAAIIIPPGEGYKNGKTYLNILNRLAENGITRDDGVVALGGGVITDLVGFAASTYMRGVTLYNVPTTLLCMVDAAVGGKNGVDLPAGKNMAGTFYEPALIIRDTETLLSMSEEQFKNGMAEVIKYAMIHDGVMFDVLEGLAASGRKITYSEKNRSLLDRIIDRCVEIKRYYVGKDRYDHCTRRILNFGHTIGHALESLSLYTLSHGNAVAKGMDYITRVSAAAGWCDEFTAHRLRELLTAYGYDLSIGCDEDDMFSRISSDKKKSGSMIDLITPDAVGRCRVRRIEMEELRRVCRGIK